MSDYRAVTALLDMPVTKPKACSRTKEGSAPGKRAIFARRTGSDWYIAAINGSEAGTIDVPLSFVGKSACTAVLLRDSDRPDAYAREQLTVGGSSRLRAAMAAGGGFVAQLRSKKSQ